MTTPLRMPRVSVPYAPARGLTLIEMMVTLVIGAVLSLAIFGVLSVAESRKRTTTSVNDVQQAGNYAVYAIDKLVRSAGSGFAQSAATSFGCLLFAANAGTQVLPRTTAPPAPFSSVNTGTLNRFRLAPVLIAPGQTTPGVSAQPSDVLVVMSGAAGFGEAPTMFLQPSAAGTDTVNLINTVSFSAGDLALLVDQLDSVTPGPQACMVQQVAAGFSGGTAQTLNLGGTYHAATIGTQTLSTISDSAVAMNLGNVTTGNMPTLALIGVGDNNTLFSYDLLQSPTAPPTPMADGVFELHALYGVDGDNDGRIDEWHDPSSSANYNLAALMDGSTAAIERLRRIRAIRVGVILRTSLRERDVVAPATLTMFADLGLTFTRTLTAAERNFRYRVIESTIPLRNAMLLS